MAGGVVRSPLGYTGVDDRSTAGLIDKFRITLK